MTDYNLTHLKQLETESIYIIREVAAEFDKPVMLYSIGKDSSVLLKLAEKAFYPGKVPFPLLHIDIGYKFKEMIGGRRLLPIICKYAEERSWNIFFMGGKNQVANRAAHGLKQGFKRLSLVGAISPSNNISKNVNESLEIIKKINNAKTNILFVGLGSPKGKIWIMKYRQYFAPMVIIEVGGTFDIISGQRKTPPNWMTNLGLEWFFRLFENPKYVWKRYLVEDPRFFCWIIKQRIKRK